MVRVMVRVSCRLGLERRLLPRLGGAELLALARHQDGRALDALLEEGEQEIAAAGVDLVRVWVWVRLRLRLRLRLRDYLYLPISPTLRTNILPSASAPRTTRERMVTWMGRYGEIYGHLDGKIWGDIWSPGWEYMGRYSEIWRDMGGDGEISGDVGRCSATGWSPG